MTGDEVSASAREVVLEAAQPEHLDGDALASDEAAPSPENVQNKAKLSSRQVVFEQEVTSIKSSHEQAEQTQFPRSPDSAAAVPQSARRHEPVPKRVRPGVSPPGLPVDLDPDRAPDSSSEPDRPCDLQDRAERRCLEIRGAVSGSIANRPLSCPSLALQAC